jgi:hypothetical protein
MKMNRFLLAAGVSLALALTFSCTEDTNDDDDVAGGEVSSSGGTTGSGDSSSSGGGSNPSSSSIVDNGLPKFEVSTIDEFLEAIGSDRNIIMAAGTYNFSEFYDYGELENENVSWNGEELTIRGVENLTIRGVLGNKDVHLTEVVTEDSYAWVLTFLNSEKITIENVYFGHKVDKGYCSGGVLAFYESSDITLNNVYMYGSGTIGLHLTDVNGAKINNSTIDECTYGITEIYNSKNISFKESVFWDNEGYNMVDVANSSNVVFDGCLFDSNVPYELYYPFFSGDEESDVVIKNTEFYDNEAGALANNDYTFTFEDTCMFDGNYWDGDDYDDDDDDPCEHLEGYEYQMCREYY